MRQSRFQSNQQSSSLAYLDSPPFSRLALMLIGLVAFLLSCSVGHAGKPKISKVFLLAGQSNMEAQGSLKELPHSLQSPPKNVFYWKKGNWKPYEIKDAWIMPGEEFGPELALAHQLAAAYPDESLGLLKVAKGGTAIKQWATGSPWMKKLLREMRAATSADHHEVAGMFWMQGERGAFYRNADGFHTGGAVLDPERNQQHVFIYAGAPGGPAGVFRLTRTLKTPQLLQGIQSRKEPHLTSAPNNP